MPLVVLVCGGRDYRDHENVHAALSKIHESRGISLVIEGGARGADELAHKWATGAGIHTARVCALWDWYGKAAGMRRNATMLRLGPSLVVAFPGGKGTENMVKMAKDANIEVIKVAP